MKTGTLLTLTTIHSIVSGLVFATLWAWFATPLGAPSIGVTHAIGLCVLVRVPFNVDPEVLEKDDVEKVIILTIAKDLVLLFIGFIARLVM